MSDDEQKTSIWVTLAPFIILWIILLFNAPFATLFFTGLFVVVVGNLLASGNGDGRNGRR